MPKPVLVINVQEGVATLTLNRPEVKNALSTELRLALSDAFIKLQNDESVGVVILTGMGDAFCAGLDLKELEAYGLSGPNNSNAGDRIMEEKLIERMESFDRPIIGAINGAAITGGFELALVCDILIASKNAFFADTHARVGILPGWGLSQKLSRLIGLGRAKELSLTGNFLSAEKADAWGLINRVVPPEDLLPTCRALARDMLSCDQDVLRAYKKLIDRGYQVSLAEGRNMEMTAYQDRARKLTAGVIASRREAVETRGRSQKADSSDQTKAGNGQKN